MGSRLDLQTILESILGSEYVYFQPPPTISMTYPCIIYQKTDLDTKFANNKPYAFKKQYSITYIDRNPDSSIPDAISLLETCIFDRRFTADNLYHDVFTIYF